MDGEVTKFEESILFFADAHKLLGPGSKFRDQSGASSQTLIDQTPVEVSPNGSGITTSYLTRGPSSLSVMSSNDSNCLSFGHRLLNLPNFSVRPGDIRIQEFTSCRGTIQDDNFARESDSDCVTKNTVQDLETWQFEVDHSVQILPGVKRIIDSIPAGRYAVATSRTKTYGNFLPTSYPVNI